MESTMMFLLLIGLGIPCICINIYDAKQCKKYEVKTKKENIKEIKKQEVTNKSNGIPKIVIAIIVGCTAWFLGSVTTEIKMQQEIEQLELQHAEEIPNLTNQYSEEIYELNNEHYEEINKLQEQINEYKEETNELQNKINELENELKQKEAENVQQINNNTNSYSYSNNSYDGDNDGDDQYDNEYADPDDIYIDENGNIIYDKYGTNRYQSNNENKTTGYGNYFIARGNSYYHKSSSCKFLEGAETERVTEDQAISRGKHQCNCIKYGY
jgi:predicted RNase H-like nuclease (RuvC/YqgF family)